MRAIEKYFCQYPLDRLIKRMARILPLGAFCLAGTLQAATLNEWTFELDANGRPLSGAINSGTNSPLAQFSAGFGTTVFTTNRALLCAGEASTTNGVWTNGAVLNAALTSTTSGVYYLRYDVGYNLSSPGNDSGTVLGVYFTGDSDAKAAGLVLGYDAGNLQSSIPVNRTLTPIPGATDIAQVGTLSAVAEVDLDNDTLKVWYDLSGSNVFTQGSPAFSTNITMTSLDNLRFHATGDFHPAGSSDYAAVDNIRQSGSWAEIVVAPLDITAPPSLSFTVTNSLAGAMLLGETNLVTVVISNATGAGAATQVTSTLSNNLSSTAFTIISNNASVSLAAGESVTNTYELIANERGNYTIYVSAHSAETNTAPKTFPLSAGANLTILPPVISEPGGAYPGRYEPGETLNITITTTNDGARAVSNIVNRLTAASAGFTNNPASDSYSSLAAGVATSTVYTVDIGGGVAAGTYTFNVTNSAGSLVWTNSFDIEVFIRAPNTDWVKANNTSNLNLGSSWVGEAVPDATDRAIFTTNITAALTNNLGTNLSFRGIALVSNTAPWTISGTNTLTLGSASIDMSQANANLTIASKLALGTTQSWNVATSRTLKVSGLISGTNTSGVVKTGAGTLEITNTLNNFKGGLTVSGGTLSVANTNILGTGVLKMDSSTLSTLSGTLLNNNMVLTNSVGITNASSLTLAGVISGPGSLTKTGAGTLFLRGDNTYSGGTTNGGIIEISTPNSLGTGLVVMNTNSTLRAQGNTFLLNMAGLANNIQLDGPATITSTATSAGNIFTVDGSISGTGKLTTGGLYFDLNGANTFSGGLVPLAVYTRVRIAQSIGSGPVRIESGSRILWPLSSMTITNDFNLAGSLRLYLAGNTVAISGKLNGVGNLDLQDVTGTLILRGDNSGWSGSIINFEDNKTLQLEHPNALGPSTANINVGGGDPGKPTVIVNVALSSRRNMTFGSTGNYPVEFQINSDTTFSGNLADGATYNDVGVLKTGAAQLTLSGNNTYTCPTEVRAGSLVVNQTLNSAITVASGATLAGTGSVQAVTMAAGSTLDLSAGRLTFGSDLTQSGAVITKLAIPNNTSYSAMVGNGANTALLQGTLHLDFTGNSGVSNGVSFTLLSNWGALTDAGVTVTQTALPGTLALDTSRLYIDGTVSLVDNPNAFITVTPWYLSLAPIAGEVAQQTVVVSNRGNVPLNFTVSDDAIWGNVNSNVAPTKQLSGGTALPLNDPATNNAFITAANDGESDTIAIGFPFLFYGITYTNLYIDSNGAIIFSSSRLVNNTNQADPTATADLPIGSRPLIAPFRHKNLEISGDVRYTRASDRLILTYNNVTFHSTPSPGTNLQFQVELFADGQIKISYNKINGSMLDLVAVGMQGNAKDYMNVDIVPSTGKAVILNDRSNGWVSYSPSSGSLAPHSSQQVIITANAAGKNPGDAINFNAWFNSSVGAPSPVAVSVAVVARTPLYFADSSLSFTGAAGQISSATFIITNSGNGPLTFTVSNTAASVSGYIGTNLSESGWIDISSIGTTVPLVNPSPNPYITKEDEGFSAMIPLGFAFPFYGNSYDSVCISPNGALRFDASARIRALKNLAAPSADMPSQMIAAYWGDLALDSNATLKYHETAERFVITWENVRQYGQGGGSNLTFQAVLTPSGGIQLNYSKLEGGQWPFTTIGLRGSQDRVLTADIRRTGDSTVTNLPYSGALYTQYVATVINRSVQFQPEQIQTIRYSPPGGTIPANSNAVLTLVGDASNQAEGSNTVVATALLNIYHNATNAASPAPLNVTFSVTNSEETVFVLASALADDSDGDGVTDDAERIAGTDPQSEGSVFAVSTADGRVLFWPSAEGRTYTVWYTLDLTIGFEPLPGASGLSTNSFTDTVHPDVAVIYYKVTVD